MRTRMPVSTVLALAAALALPAAGCTGDAPPAPDALDAADGVAADLPLADPAGDLPPSPPPEFTRVDVAPGTPATVQLAVQACAGLHNRARGGSVYTVSEAKDPRWLEELGLEPAETLDANAFLLACLGVFPKCVRYDYASQQRLLPAVLTVAAALEAVPLDTGMDAACGSVAFDATVEFAARDTPELATRYAREAFLADTTGLAMLNPGYELAPANVRDPAITRDMPAALVDLVFSHRLFVAFLVNGCVEGSSENRELQAVVDGSPWPRPVGVYGYNNSWLVAGGYLNEAQTRCLASRNLGAIPTETTNLSFFSTRRAPVTAPAELAGNPPEGLAWDPATTYVAFVVGDGDNVQYILATRNEWLRQRLEDCEEPGSPCAPLTWSLSPHLPRLAPDVLEWYFATTRRTGKDHFILPPSGHLYAYPTSLAEGDQDRFVAATEQDARLLGIRGTVHWDWSDSWEDAEARFLPRYARRDGAIRGVFPVNVPYMFPAFPGWDDGEFYRVLAGADGGEVVVFRPRQWRGVDGSGSGLTEPFFLTTQQMAAELGAYPPGTVTWVYLTSDGGLSLENSFLELARLLPSHVRLVGADDAADLALQAWRARARGK